MTGKPVSTSSPNQPIATAPKDKPILVFNRFFGWYVSQWDGRDFPLGYSSGVFGHWFPVPSHWRPIPETPL